MKSFKNLSKIFSFIGIMERIIFILAVPTQATRSAFCFLHLAQRLHFFLGMCSVTRPIIRVGFFFGFSDKYEMCLRVVGGNNYIFNDIYKWRTTEILSRILTIFLHFCEILNSCDKNEMSVFFTIFTFISQLLVELHRKLK